VRIPTRSGCSPSTPSTNRTSEPGSELDRLFEQVWGNDWVNLVVDQVSGLNAVVFHGGLGDGGYATWIGRGVEGEPVCFVVDLLVFSDSFGPIAD
jgi:hypothetical protein